MILVVGKRLRIIFTPDYAALSFIAFFGNGLGACKEERRRNGERGIHAVDNSPKEVNETKTNIIGCHIGCRHSNRNNEKLQKIGMEIPPSISRKVRQLNEKVSLKLH